MKTRGFERIVSYVEDETGFATSYYDESYLKRRVATRMRRTDTDDYGSYLSRLHGDADERAALLDALSINVTSFFRNPLVWEGIGDLLAGLLAERGQVKLWSAACSDGREAYSMAMLALADPAVDASNVSITATDVDRGVLEVARRGVYESTQTTDIGEELGALGDFSEHVTRDGGRYEVSEEVRSMVEFERHDLIRGEPKTDFDLVACRNLFIYIDAEYKLPVVRTVKESLRDGGYLVIGKTETLPEELKGDFDAVERRLRIYQRTVEKRPTASGS